MITKYNNIGQRIKKLRLYLQLTGESFGQAIGITKQAVSMIENNQRDVSSVLIRKIVDRFKIDARFFFGQIDSIEEADLSRNNKSDLDYTKPPVLLAIETLSLEIKYLEREIKHIKDFICLENREQFSMKTSNFNDVLKIINQMLPLEEKCLLKIKRVLEDHLSKEDQDKPL